MGLHLLVASMSREHVESPRASTPSHAQSYRLQQLVHSPQPVEMKHQVFAIFVVFVSSKVFLFEFQVSSGLTLSEQQQVEEERLLELTCYPNKHSVNAQQAVALNFKILTIT